MKAFFSEPVTGVDATTFTLTDDAGTPGARLRRRRSATAPGRSSRTRSSCSRAAPTRPAWRRGSATSTTTAPAARSPGRFTTGENAGEGTGDTRVPIGFPAASPPPPATRPLAVAAVRRGKPDGAVTVAFSRPVLNVTPLTFQVREGDCDGGPVLPGHLAASAAGDRWAFTPERPPRRTGGRSA